VISVENIDVGLLVDVASVRGTEKCWRDLAGLELIISPLRPLGIVPRNATGVLSRSRMVTRPSNSDKIA